MANQFQSKYTGLQIESLLDSVKELSPSSGRNYELYAFKKCTLDSNPYSRIYYLEDNKDYNSVGMDYNTNIFNYGDWANAWFIKNIKPVMLNYDGTVAYELNPNDYTKKLDGSDSNVSDTQFNGNAMIGIPTVYMKIYQIGIWQYFYFCNIKLDNSYEAFAHTDSDGNIIDYCYMPIFNGSVVNGKLRSISGLNVTSSLTASAEINAAISNNLSGDAIWYTELFADIMLINNLLTLISKSSNSQMIFGNGHYTGGSSASSLLKTGTMNDKGLFYGTNGTGKGVKVFGIENWWGNTWRRIGGYIYASNTQKVKLTYGTQDGSGIIGYNLDGTGYIEIPNSTCSGSSGEYILKTIVNKYGCFPIQTGATQDTYECDGLWYTSSTTYALFGGYCGGSDGFRTGTGCMNLTHAMSSAYWYFSASLSCKPKANK